MGKHIEQLKVLDIQSKLFWSKFNLSLIALSVCLALAAIYNTGSAFGWAILLLFVFHGYSEIKKYRYIKQSLTRIE